MSTQPSAIQTTFPFVPAPEIPSELHLKGKFVLPVGEYGTTFRRGPKWAAVPAGTILALVEDPENVTVGQGIVVDVSKCVFRELPARTVELCHSPNSRTYTSLLAAMRRAYGDDFSEDEIVVVMTYQRLS